ncbi:hypothetical protein [Lyngbya sp. PCC 8106]|uniref:hypothetical protein n=1 Tax=Lyngbya sp. (strain PCC 8106) TaxID=313612 RepID=UPI0000EA9766|nr:hypothetical protein [Lyngbya sp. PCC 8106]EAW34228.1 hypothetical protein L8106_08976 [Lyngbya sp. PCC 8106]
MNKIKRFPQLPLKPSNSAILASVIGFELVIVAIYLGSILLTGEPYAPFDMNGQMTIPSFLQAFYLFAIGLIALMLFVTERRSKLPPSGGFKLAIAILLLYATLDEIFEIHLQLDNWFSVLGKGDWMGIYLGVFSIAPAVWYKDVRKLWRVYRQEALIVLLGLTLLIVGGLGAELFKGSFRVIIGLLFQHDFIIFFAEKVRVAIEEFSELLGETLILYAAFLFLKKRRRCRFLFARGSG